MNFTANGMRDNVLQMHLHQVLSQNLPWLSLSETAEASRVFARAQSAKIGFWKKLSIKFQRGDINLALLHYPPVMKDDEVKRHLYAMCREQILAVREKVTHLNCERIVSERYGQTPEAQSCTARFNELLKGPHDQEELHIYRPTTFEFKMDDDEGGCKCLRQVVTIPEGVIPAPVPDLAGGVTGVGGGRPVGRPQPAYALVNR